MQSISLPCLVMASILFYLGLYHFFLYLKRKKAGEHLPFSLLCFGVVLYDLFCIGLYNAHSIEEGVFWQRLQLDSVNLISFAIVWFALRYARPEKISDLKYFGIWYLFILIVSTFINPEYTVSINNPSIKNIEFFGLHVTYYESKIGLLYSLEIASSIITYVYVLYFLIIYYLKKRDNNTIIIIISQIVYFAGVINDSLVTSGLYSFIYVSEYAFLLIVLSMAHTLHNEFISLHKTVEAMNRGLEEKIKNRTAEIEKLNEELKHLADVDGLTGAYNRRFFNEYFQIEIRRTRNLINYKEKIEKCDNEMNFCLSIIDIDNFKQINDHFGHLEGDRVLVEIVNEINKNLFTRDILFRYGGEEFVILFTRTSKAGILMANEKVRKCIENKTFYFNNDKFPRHITVSIGTVLFEDEPDKSNKELLRIADERLLIAKKSGKNKIVYMDTFQGSIPAKKQEWNNDLIVLQSTCGFLKGDIATLVEKDTHMSAHFFIGRNGVAYQLFNTNFWSYHLGKGAAGGNAPNSKRSIAIEISNIGPLTVNGSNLLDCYGKPQCTLNETAYYTKIATPFHGYQHFASFTKIQYTTLKSMLNHFCSKWSIPKVILPESKRYQVFERDANSYKGICTHVNYRPDGKTDVGPAFDWRAIV